MCNNRGRSPDNYAKWKNPIPKGYTPYDCIYITFLDTKMVNKLVVVPDMEEGDCEREVDAGIKGQ